MDENDKTVQFFKTCGRRDLNWYFYGLVGIEHIGASRLYLRQLFETRFDEKFVNSAISQFNDNAGFWAFETNSYAAYRRQVRLGARNAVSYLLKREKEQKTN